MDKPKKGKHKYSPIWNLFEVIDRDCAKCLICAKRFSYRSTTSNLRKHLERKHSTLQVIHSNIPKVNSEIAEYASSQSQIFQIATPQKKVAQQTTPQHIQIKLIPTQQLSTPTVNAQQIYTPQFNLQNSIGLKKVKKDRKSSPNEPERTVNDALMQLFIRDFHPINMVEDEGFRNLVAMLNPSYEIPSKQYISRTLLPSMYEKCLENSRIVARTITSACVTTECWTSTNDESFLAITAHFLDSDFFLKSILLSCSLLEENFTSESLAEELSRNINEWDLQNKIFFSVSSGEDYIANAFKIVLKWEHFGCFIHSLNKIIGDALNLKPVEELLLKVRQVVSFFKNDPMASSELQLSQINCNMEPKKLKQDIPMMWNSTYYMIERFVELENAISSCTVTIQESNYLLIQPDEWTVLKELTKILKSLEAVTKAADQENYMLASLPIVLANGLFEICRKLESCAELSDTTKQVVTKLKSGFHSRFNGLTKNPILSVCTFLDPRFKTIPFGNNEGPVKKRVVDLVIKHLNIDNNSQLGDSQIANQSQNIEELSVWEVFDKSAASSKLEASGDSRAQLEVDRYIEDELINRNSDPLEWWRIHRYNYPHLSEVVREIFSSLATSVPCSRLFTKAGNMIMDRRSKLSSGKLKQLVFLNANDRLFV